MVANIIALCHTYIPPKITVDACSTQLEGLAKLDYACTACYSLSVVFFSRDFKATVMVHAVHEQIFVSVNDPQQNVLLGGMFTQALRDTRRVLTH